MQKLCIVINVLGGIGVIGSYVFGIATHHDNGAALWGSIPENLRVFYTASMLVAAVSYFAFSYFIIFRLNPADLKIFAVIYCLILIPSMFWMPLTYMMLANPSTVVWVAIRLVLATVGIGSLGLVVALLFVQPRPLGWSYGLAVAGAALFCFHTLVLDALIWPIYMAK